MDNYLYLINLYDYYSELLTEKQRKYFEEYYFNNLSLSEISENNKISRNAVHKNIKDTEKKLELLENKLKLYEKSIKIKQIINKLDDKMKKQIEDLL